MSADAEPEEVVSAAATDTGVSVVTQRGAVISLSFMALPTNTLENKDEL